MLDGEGARRRGGRWNAPGRPVVYTSSSVALATLEILVHMDSDLLPSTLAAFTVDVPDGLGREKVALADLPDGWRIEEALCRPYGEAWLDRGQAAILLVPSAIVPTETNVLLNPRHADMGQIRVVAQERFVLDPRLVRRRPGRA